MLFLLYTDWLQSFGELNALSFPDWASGFLWPSCYDLILVSNKYQIQTDSSVAVSLVHCTVQTELCFSLIIFKTNSHLTLRQRCNVTVSNLLASYVSVSDLGVHLKVAVRWFHAKGRPDNKPQSSAVKHINVRDLCWQAASRFRTNQYHKPRSFFQSKREQAMCVVTGQRRTTSPWRKAESVLKTWWPRIMLHNILVEAGVTSYDKNS